MRIIKNTKNKFFVPQKLKSFRGKKAWLRILEAFIAVILITSVLLVLYSRTISNPNKSEEIYRLQESILNEVAENSSLRREVLTGQGLTEIENFISKRIPPGFVFNVRVCNVGEICELELYMGEEGKEIYSKERIISSDLTSYNPKKLKIFMWVE